MKKLFLLITLFTLQTQFTHSQWLQMPAFPVAGNVYSISFLNKDTGYVSMDTPVLLRTTNSGQTWSIVGSYKMYQLQFTDNLIGYANGRLTGNGRVYKTTNAGLSWDSTFISANTYSSIFFVSKDTGWLSGYDGFNSVMWRTTNGGANFQQQFATPGSGYEQIFFLKEKINNYCYGWARGGNALYRTTNSGVNWAQIYLLESIPMCGGTGSFIDLYFTDTSNGIALRTSNCILKTTDGGFNWSIKNEFNLGTLSRIGMANSQTGWITIPFDTVLKTNDFFQTYGKQYHPLFTPGEIFVMDTNYAWSGKTGFARTTNGGGNIASVNIISNEVPKEFKLYQNYPNPFNPATNIRYQISKNGYVKLVVFDVLGRSIKVLVDQYQKAGIYETSLDVVSFSSGIYFYRIITEHFTETKKATLLK